jgi:hypothetical protein
MSITLKFFVIGAILVDEYEWDEEYQEFINNGGSEYWAEDEYVVCTSKISPDNFGGFGDFYVNSTVILTEEVAEKIPTSYSLRNRDMTGIELRTLEMINNSGTESTQ